MSAGLGCAGVQVPLPGGPLQLACLVLDLNGTLGVEGALLPGVRRRVRALRRRMEVVLVSGDTFGTAGAAAEALGIPIQPLRPEEQGAQKLRIVSDLGAASLAMVGNGRNDAAALAAAAVGICVVGPEGAAREALAAADVVVRSPQTALDLLLNPVRLAATLRD